tara:strand:- start:1396 stop:2340 length:945 start_codon:yes stop_codon:yes gene_type:complete
MKTIIHKSLFASIGALLLTLTGCIDVKQDIWINEDGSGKFVFDVGLSKQFKAMMDLQKGFGDLEGLEDDGEGNDNGLNEIPFSESPEKVVEELKKNEFVTEAEFEEAVDAKYDRTIYTIQLSDITKIKDVLSSSSLGAAARELGGDNNLEENNDFELKKTDSGTYELSVSLKGNEEDKPEDPQEAEFAATMMKQMFGDAAMTLRVNAPAVTHNGKEEDASIVWTMLLADLAAGGNLEAKGEFKPGGSDSSKEEEPKEEEPKEEEPKEELTQLDAIEKKEEMVNESVKKTTNTLIIGGLVAVILLLVVLLMRKKS